MPVCKRSVRIAIGMGPGSGLLRRGDSCLLEGPRIHCVKHMLSGYSQAHWRKYQVCRRSRQGAFRGPLQRSDRASAREQVLQKAASRVKEQTKTTHETE